MVCPSLISVSFAPGLYFFCACALGTPAIAATKPSINNHCFFMFTPVVSVSAISNCSFDFCSPAPYSRCGKPHESRDAGWHDIDEGEQKYPIDRPRRRLGNLVGEVGHELDEQRAVECAGDRSDAADDDTDQEID